MSIESLKLKLKSAYLIKAVSVSSTQHNSNPSVFSDCQLYYDNVPMEMCVYACVLFYCSASDNPTADLTQVVVFNELTYITHL